MMRGAGLAALALAGLIFSACSKDSKSSLFDRKADNSFTRMVDGGADTMIKAQTNVDKLNANTSEQEKEMKDMANQQ